MEAFKVFPGFLSNVLVAVAIAVTPDEAPIPPVRAADFGK
jgi:hypothetical protein